MDNPPKDRPKYSADLRKLHQHVHKGVHSSGAGVQYMSLKKKYPKKYADSFAEHRGERSFFRGRSVCSWCTGLESLVSACGSFFRRLLAPDWCWGEGLSLF